MRLGSMPARAKALMMLFKRLREIDRRLGFLARRMKAAKVIDPAAQPGRDRLWLRPPLAAGTTCDDGSACTTGDVCSPAGVCGGTAINCDDEWGSRLFDELSPMARADLHNMLTTLVASMESTTDSADGS